jgi:hypothetical protein
MDNFTILEEGERRLLMQRFSEQLKVHEPVPQQIEDK